MAFFKKHLNLLIVLGVSLWGLYLRFVCLRDRAFDGDDLYQYECMKGAFKAFWLPQKYGDFSSFPGDYLLNYIPIQIFGLDKWGLATAHILATILGFYLLYRIGQCYFQTWVGYLVCFMVVALNSTLIFHSFEFRPYAILPVLGLVGLLFAHRCLDSLKRWNNLTVFFAAVLIVITFNFHAYGPALFLMPLFCVIVTALIGPNRSAVVDTIKGNKLKISLFVLATLLAIAIWLYYTSFNNSWVPPSAYDEIHTFQYIVNPLENPAQFLKSIFGNLIGDKRLYFLLFSIVVALFIPLRRRWEQFTFFGLLVALPIALILIADIKGHYWFLQRQFVWVMPFFAIFLGWQWDSIYSYFLTRKTNRL